MMQNMVFQISVFGNFTSIKANDETIRSMTNKLQDYSMFPAVFQEQNLTLSNKPELTKSEIINRLQMVSLDKNISVTFATNRIDIKKVSTDVNNGVNDNDLDVLLDILDKAADGLSFTRVGFNTTSLLEDANDHVLAKMQPDLKFYNSPNELLMKINKRIDVDLGNELIEKSNVVLISQKTMGQLLINNQQVSVDNKLVLQFDINTIPEAKESRFFYEQTKAYIYAAKAIREDLIKQLTLLREV